MVASHRCLLLLLLCTVHLAHAQKLRPKLELLRARLKAPKADDRIVGGVPASVARIKYIVQVRYDGEFSCGGTLVSPRHVVTAAHCVSGRSVGRMVVLGGTSRLGENGVQASVSRAYLPRGFDMQSLRQDVAVLRLATRLRGNNIAAIGLCNSRLSTGDVVRVSGWGLTSENSNTVSRQLRTVQMPVVSQEICRRAYGNLSPAMFCVGVSGQKDSCSGDSGGPLIHGGRLCGIVSYGDGCARPGFPGVYTSISVVRSFIVNSMRK